MRRTITLLVLLLAGMVSGFWTFSARAGDLGSDTADYKTVLPFVMLNYVQGPGSVTGTVFDATSIARAPLGDVTVCYEDNCAVTAGDGIYLIENLPDGYRKLGASRVDYYNMTEDVVIRPFETAEQDFAMTPLSEITEVFMRVLLTWSETETWPPDDIRNDLDAHLWLEAPTPPTHVDFTDRGDCTTFPNACLEVDYQKGYGPETLAIRQLENTVYYYGVLNYYADYPGVPEITQLQAKVRVYQEGGTILEYTIPTVGEGDFWYVFQLISDGSTATVVEKNCITVYDGNPPLCPEN